MSHTDQTPPPDSSQNPISQINQSPTSQPKQKRKNKPLTPRSPNKKNAPPYLPEDIRDKRFLPLARLRYLSYSARTGMYIDKLADARWGFLDVFFLAGLLMAGMYVLLRLTFPGVRKLPVHRSDHVSKKTSLGH
jgi:hypothetical protein